jgi:hypothetical protein
MPLQPPISFYADDQGHIYPVSGGVAYTDAGGATLAPSPYPITLPPASGNANAPYPALHIDMLKGGQALVNQVAYPFTSRITFTRADATSCAGYFDSTGRYAVAAANVPRFDYDPVTPAAYGPELAQYIDFTQGTTGWTLADSGQGTMSVTAGVLKVTRTAGGLGASQPVSVVAGSTYTFTAVLSAVDAIAGAQIQVKSGTAEASTTLALSSASTTPATLTVTYQATATGTVYIFLRTGYVSGFGSAYWTGVSVKSTTFTPRGLLIEESRTNLLLQSRDMTNASWSKTT